MIYVVREPQGTFACRIQENNQGIVRILDDTGGFDSIGDALNFSEKIKKAVSLNMIEVLKEPLLRTFGYNLMEIAPNGNRQVLISEDGWSTPDEVNEHLSSLRRAISEGTKTIL